MSDLPVYELECAVIGAGVVGLAVARAIAKSGTEVLILEKASAFGTETSARNSEVIHAGIYYPAGSLKAKACVEGRRALYEYAALHGVAHKNCGKIIAATNAAQVSELEGIAKKAEVNGVEGMELLDADQLRALEPALKAQAGLLSTTTGIIDSHSYMLSLLGEAEDHGANLVLETEVERGEILPDGRTRLVCGGKEPCEIIVEKLVNSAGLWAPSVASKIAGFDRAYVPEAHFAKGSYFSLEAKAPFSRLIYPVPEKGGLGVHLTLDMGGQARFGPDVEWQDTLDLRVIDYEVNGTRGDKFYAAIRDYWPDLPDNALKPAYSGMRPKLASKDAPNADFIVSGPTQHGAEGQVHLFGIESPGLTSSLAIADLVLDRLS